MNDAEGRGASGECVPTQSVGTRESGVGTGGPPATGPSITREALALLPIRKYEGTVQVPVTPEELQQALADIRQEHVIGFDTETRPSFNKGQAYLPSLVQLATARTVYLFRPQLHDVADALAEVLGNPLVVKTGVAVVDDLRKLKELFPFTERNVIDLGDIAKRQGLAQTGVRNLVGLFLGWRVTKGSRTSNWAREHLSRGQITYAATDAWACRELYVHFQRLGWLTPHGTGP